LAKLKYGFGFEFKERLVGARRRSPFLTPQRAAIAPANVNDHILLEAAIEAIVAEGLLMRCERKSENHLAQLQFACALPWYRRLTDLAAVFP
jgi:hypothetical protein